MKCVIYHVEGPKLWVAPPNAYKRLFDGFNENAKFWNYKTIHLTSKQHAGWGDENIYYDGLSPEHVVYNREQVFTKFLLNAEDDVYLFTEPDARIKQKIPPLDEEIDLALLYRPEDGVPLTPSFRLARKSAWPWFVETWEEMKKQPMKLWSWHGDSAAWNSMYKKLGKPKKTGVIRYNNMNIELREWGLYNGKKAPIMEHPKHASKAQLLK